MKKRLALIIAVMMMVTCIIVPEAAFAAEGQNALTSSVVKETHKGAEYYPDEEYAEYDIIKISNQRCYDKAYAVLTRVNNQRVNMGLPKVKMDKSLLETAMKRAAETALCFEHVRPNGQMCFTANNKMNAENIALGQTTAAQVMTGWMNSPGHRANILSRDARSIGIGCVYHNGIYYWVQCFSSSQAVTLNIPSNKTVTTAVELNPELGVYDPYLSVATNKIKAGNTVKATFIMPNATVQGIEAIAVPGCVKWTSGSNKCSVGTGGVIKGHAYGKSTIKGSLGTLSATKVINVTGSITAVINNCKYRVFTNKNVAVAAFTSTSATKATVYDKVKIKGSSYNVASIQKEAFKGKSKLKTITINSTKITFVGKDAFKGINKNATIKVPASCLDKYTKMIRNSGAANSVKIVAK